MRKESIQHARGGVGEVLEVRKWYRSQERPRKWASFPFHTLSQCAFSRHFVLRQVWEEVRWENTWEGRLQRNAIWTHPPKLPCLVLCSEILSLAKYNKNAMYDQINMMHLLHEWLNSFLKWETCCYMSLPCTLGTIGIVRKKDFKNLNSSVLLGLTRTEINERRKMWEINASMISSLLLCGLCQQACSLWAIVTCHS